VDDTDPISEDQPLRDLSGQISLALTEVRGDPVRERLDNEFLLPIHEFVQFSEREVEIIDHPAFQRLFVINQLAQTDLVYRGATHSRGAHSLGAVAAVQLFIDALDESAGRPDSAGSHEWRTASPLTSHERTFVRLAALLHDIGHVVAGHTLEDELGLLGHHDGQERIDYVLDRPTWGGRPIEDTAVGEPLRGRIDRLYRGDAAAIGLRRQGEDQILGPCEILSLLIAKEGGGVEDGAYESKHSFRVRVLQDMVGNTICADLLDYLHRDWQNIGKPRHFDKRLLHYFEMRESGDASRLVVNLQSSKPGRYRSDAITAILDLLESRYQLWEIALMHRTRTAAASMLERAIAELAAEADYFGDDTQQAAFAAALLDTLIEVSDTDLLRVLVDDVARGPLARVLPDGFTMPGVTSDLLWDLRFRVLHKQVAYVGAADGIRVDALVPPADTDRGARLEAAKARLTSIRELELDFGLEPGSLTMYLSPVGLGAKVAKVQVLFKDRVEGLDAAEQLNELSGGHLDAQVRRFERLRRAVLFARPEAAAQIDATRQIETLALAFKVGVLRIESDQSMRTVAQLLASDPGSPHHGKRLLDEPALAGRELAGTAYPSGAPTARSFFRD
jgi:HD superfamily phosphohydrolase